MAERRTYPKSTCCVPGCPRWSRKFPHEWLCGRHWKMVPRRYRRALNKVWARLTEIYLTNQPDGPHGAARVAWERAEVLGDRLWSHATRAAILREAGL